MIEQVFEEENVGVWIACSIQGWSDFHCQWQMQGTHQLHSAWHCCQNSRCLFMRINIKPLMTLLMRWKLVMGYANGFWLLNWTVIVLPNFCRISWQVIRSSSVLTCPRSFYRPPQTVQLYCPVLSQAMKAGFMVMTLRQSSNHPDGKVQLHQDQ